MPIVARCWWARFKATAIAFAIATLVAALGGRTVSAQQEVFYLEDWDTTPEVPDALRGWRDSTPGQGILDFEEGQGNFLRNNFYVGIPLYLATFDSNDPDDWMTNAYVGDRDYRDLNISRVEFEARHDIASGIQSPATYMSLMLYSDQFVDDPEDPDGVSNPVIWTHSANLIHLDAGWDSVSLDIPYNASSPPDGWYVYPDSIENWNLVMQDVDGIRVCFCRFQPGIGGILAVWNAGLDNFTVYQGDPIGAQPVPALDRNGIIALIALFGLLAAGWWLRSGREM